MKVKYFCLFLMSLILATALQPIYSADPRGYAKTGINISDQYGGCGNQFNLNSSTEEKFKLFLFSYHCIGGNPNDVEQRTLAWRWIVFDLYKLNTNGLDPVLYYHDRKMTNWRGLVETANIRFEPGDYVLIVSYGGNKKDKLSPSDASVKIHVS